MWPSKPSPVAKLVAEALAPETQGGAQVKLLEALAALPPDPQSIECYSKLAFDTRQIRMVRSKAVECLGLTATPEGARALLRGLETPDMRGSVLIFLGGPRQSALLPGMSADACASFAGALRAIAAEAETKARDSQREDVVRVQKLLLQMGTADAQAIASQAEQLLQDLRQRNVPAFLERALKSRTFHEVKQAVAEMEKLGTPEARAALEKFRSVPSRLVEEQVVGGVGTSGDTITRQVYTSKFGQPQCEEERALHQKWLEEDKKRRAAAGPEA